MEWISVKDRLPEPEEYVLVHGDGGKYWRNAGENIFLAFLCVDEKQREILPWNDCNLFKTGTCGCGCDWYPQYISYVTHWMPLPQPPTTTG